jgi:homocysteine S-methyltransferase
MDGRKNVAGVLAGVRVLDGGFASELEYLGAKIDGPLWSAHVLEDAPEKVVAVHRAYLEAGADCILTASYQVSRMGYAEYGLPEARADQALLKAAELAQQAVKEWRIETGAEATGAERRVVVASSLGPFGAALHNGSEYHGNYGRSFAEIVAFHRSRIEVLGATMKDAAAVKDGSVPDLLAFETLPSLEEARAIYEALRDFPDLPVWFSFTCRDEKHVAHGELLRECAALVAALPQAVAVGVNCTYPALIEGLIGELKAATLKLIVVYPNSGEGWDAEKRVWTGASDAVGFGESAKKWFAAGAQIVGGCCRTRPEHVMKIAACC